MKQLTAIVLGLTIFQGVVYADHAKLKTLSYQIGIDATRVANQAYRIIGTRPTPRQRYAYEHVYFLHQSAHRFENAVLNRTEIDRDHPSYVRQLFQELDRDTRNARRTLPDLTYFAQRDHASELKLIDQSLTSIEISLQEMSLNLP